MDKILNIIKFVEKKKNTEICVICMTEVADYLLLPCGHQCGCNNCLNSLKNEERKCPICRIKFTNLVKVFRSGITEEIKEVKVNVEKKNIKSKVNVDQKYINTDKKNNDNLYNANLIEKNIKICVAPCEDIKNMIANIAISVKVPDTSIRRPVDICCVIDISGSMGEDAKF